MANLWDPERPVKRTLGIRDKQILYERSHHRCENPACGKTLKNSVALCWRCNKLQGTDIWPVFLKKQGITVPSDSLRQLLTKLTLSELKFLATKHGVKLKGRV